VDGLAVGGSTGITVEFERPAGGEFNVTDVRVSAMIFVDYDDGDGVEVHFAAEAASPCPASGINGSGTLTIAKPGTMQLEAVMQVVHHCEEGASPDWIVHAQVPSANVLDAVQLTNVELAFETYPPAVGGADGGKRTFKGDVKGTLILSGEGLRLPTELAGSSASIGVATRVVVGVDGKVTTPDGVNVDLHVIIDYGGFIRVEGAAGFKLPCEGPVRVHSPNLRLTLDAPLPRLDTSDLNLTAPCAMQRSNNAALLGAGGEDGEQEPDFEMSARVGTFTLSDGITMDELSGSISGKKVNDQWSIDGELCGKGGATRAG
jgi:hypothetical protein